MEWTDSSAADYWTSPPPQGCAFHSSSHRCQPPKLLQGIEAELPRPDLLSGQPKVDPEELRKDKSEEGKEVRDASPNSKKLSTSAPDLFEIKDTPPLDTPSGDRRLFHLSSLCSASAILADDAPSHINRLSQEEGQGTTKDDGRDVFDAGCTTVCLAQLP